MSFAVGRRRGLGGFRGQRLQLVAAGLEGLGFRT